ncbi:hypothetical protein S40293_10347 [Stachybotrys chartarum IBT 40293]|nr:hypothetical protein S40293_10347 [Stachybotrys chartarum IBT 40293]
MPPTLAIPSVLPDLDPAVEELGSMDSQPGWIHDDQHGHDMGGDCLNVAMLCVVAVVVCYLGVFIAVRQRARRAAAYTAVADKDEHEAHPEEASTGDKEVEKNQL